MKSSFPGRRVAGKNATSVIQISQSDFMCILRVLLQLHYGWVCIAGTFTASEPHLVVDLTARKTSTHCRRRERCLSHYLMALSVLGPVFEGALMPPGESRLSRHLRRRLKHKGIRATVLQKFWSSLNFPTSNEERILL